MSVRFDLEAGWQCRIFVLADDLVRVLFLRHGHAAGAADVDDRARRTPTCRGRDAIGSTSSGFARPAFAVAESEARDHADDRGSCRWRCALRPFGLALVSRRRRCSRPIGRPTRTNGASAADIVRHYMARALSDRYFGLGDKTGPLDKHGRRLRTLALDALGYDARDVRSAVQALAVPDRPR